MRCIPVLFFLLIVGDSCTQTFEWAKTFGSATQDLPTTTVMDKYANIYTVGYFAGTVDFNAGSGTDNLTSAVLKDMFVAKYNWAGNFIWTGKTGSIYNDHYWSARTIRIIQPRLQKVNVDLHELSSGIYFVSVVNNGIEQTVKLVKE